MDSLAQLNPGERERVAALVRNWLAGDVFVSTVSRSRRRERLGFLRKVYGILSAQLLLTVLVCSAFMMYPPLANFAKGCYWTIWTLLVTSIGLVIALHAYKREVPTNYVILAVFTLIESVMLGIVVSQYTISSVLVAMGLTLSVTVALTVYTFQYKRDYSSMGAGLFTTLWCLLGGIVMQMFFPMPHIHTAISVVGAVLFCVYIVYDTHQIMEKLSPEDYIEGAIQLYLDIVNVFLYILDLMGNRKND